MRLLERCAQALEERITCDGIEIGRGSNHADRLSSLVERFGSLARGFFAQIGGKGDRAQLDRLEKLFAQNGEHRFLVSVAAGAGRLEIDTFHVTAAG